MRYPTRVGVELSGDRSRFIVSQASGMVARQLECGVIEAFDRLRDRSVDLDQSLEHTALDVIDGVIRFD